MFAADARKHTPGKNAEKENFSMRILVCDDDAAFAGQLAEKINQEESTHERNHEATFARSRTENHSKYDPPRIRWLAAPKRYVFLPAPPPGEKARGSPA